MKKVLIVAVILLCASAAAAKFPVAYQCFPMDGHPLTLEVCRALFLAVESNPALDLTTDFDTLFFQIIILPVDVNGYIAVTIATGFVYPPWDGVALASYHGTHLVLPGKFDEKISDRIIQSAVDGMAQWFLQYEEQIRAAMTEPCEERRSYRYEVSNG